MTRSEAIRMIEDLIDSFPDELFKELCEEMVDRAQTALDARIEEESKD